MPQNSQQQFSHEQMAQMNQDLSGQYAAQGMACDPNIPLDMALNPDSNVADLSAIYFVNSLSLRHVYIAEHIKNEKKREKTRAMQLAVSPTPETQNNLKLRPRFHSFVGAQNP